MGSVKWQIPIWLSETKGFLGRTDDTGRWNCSACSRSTFIFAVCEQTRLANVVSWIHTFIKYVSFALRKLLTRLFESEYCIEKVWNIHYLRTSVTLHYFGIFTVNHYLLFSCYPLLRCRAQIKFFHLHRSWAVCSRSFHVTPKTSSSCSTERRQVVLERLVFILPDTFQVSALLDGWVNLKCDQSNGTSAEGSLVFAWWSSTAHCCWSFQAKRFSKIVGYTLLN